MKIKRRMYAHTPPFSYVSHSNEEIYPDPISETLEFERYSDGVSMKDVEDGLDHIDYKFNEGELIQEFKDYIDSTYNAHYCTSGIQSSEVIIDRGHGMGFFLGNVDKYNARYGNKGDVVDHRKDLMKVLHYALLALHTHDLEND
tara:strand:+ start:157 stop:588 length:432 start_codon:yes stop_codon:yes gene_type:complete